MVKEGDPAIARDRRAVAGARASRLLADMQASRRTNGLLSLSYVATLLAVLPIHLLNLALAASGVALLWPGRTITEKVLGVLALASVLAFRPRLRWVRGAGLLDQSPATAALLVDIAQAVGGPPPTRLTVSSDFNAHVARTGIRGRTLDIGAPLWAALSPEERIAVLGHELGHLANSDVRSSRIVASALTSLAQWTEVFAMRTVTYSRAYAIQLLLQVVLWPVRVVLTGYLRVITLLAAASHRRQEHYADLASAVAGGSDGACRMLEVTLMSGATETIATKARLERSDVYDAIRDRFASYDDATFRNARHRSGAATSRVDDSHPPTLNRLVLIESRPRVTAAVVRSAQEWARIDAELLPSMRKAAEVYADRRIHRF